MSAGLLLLFLLAYGLTIQRYLYGDGGLLLKMASRGPWELNKVLYPPLYASVHHARQLFGAASPRTSLEWVSVLCSSLSMPVLYLAARRVGVGRAAAILSVLLVGSAPTAWFFATAIEVHAPQLLAATLAVALAVSPVESRFGPRNPLSWALCLAMLFGTHPTGLLWAPAMACYCSSVQGPRVARGYWYAAVGLLIAVAATYLYLIPAYDSAGIYRQELERAPTQWDAKLLFRDLGLGAGLLLPLAAVAGIAALRRGVFGWKTALSLLLLFLPFLVFLPAFRVYERGAYYISLLPVLGLSAATLTRSVPRSVYLLLLCLPLQAGFAYAEIRRFEEQDPEYDWILELERSTPANTCVLVDPGPEGRALRRHTSFVVVAVDEVLVRVPAQRFLAWLRRNDLELVVMSALLENPKPIEKKDYVLRLLERAGEQRPLGSRFLRVENRGP